MVDFKTRCTVAATVTHFPELESGLTPDRARQLAAELPAWEREAWVPRVWTVLEHRPELRAAAVLLLLALGGCSAELWERAALEQAAFLAGAAIGRQLN